MKFLFVLILWVLPVVALSQTKNALVIGNNNYVPSVGPLNNPVNDARMVRAALEEIGFKVIYVEDGKRIQTLRAIEQFKKLMVIQPKSSIGLIYYSGHGVAQPETNSNFIIPIDITNLMDADIWYNAIKLDDVIDSLKGSAPHTAIFVLFDACRDVLRLPVRGAAKGFVGVAGRQGLFISFSTSPGQTATDVGEGAGPYARALAAALRRPGLSHLDVFQSVKEGVYRSTLQAQIPWESNGLISLVVLNDTMRAGSPVNGQPILAAPAGASPALMPNYPPSMPTAATKEPEAQPSTAIGSSAPSPLRRDSRVIRELDSDYRVSPSKSNKFRVFIRLDQGFFNSPSNMEILDLETKDTRDISDKYWDVSPNNKLAVVFGGKNSNQFSIYSVADGARVNVFKGHTNVVDTGIFNNSGSMIFSASADHTIRLWDIKSAKTVKIFRGHTYVVNWIVLSSDGSTLLSGGHDNKVIAWDVSTSRKKWSVQSANSTYRVPNISDDGYLAAIYTANQTVEIWNVISNTKISEFKLKLDKPEAELIAVSFSPDKKLIASAYNNTIMVFDVSSGVLRSVLEGHSDKVNWVKFSRDGALIYSASNTSVREWAAPGG